MARFGVILADPPWRYGGSNQFQGKGRTIEVQGRFRGPEREQYATMHTDEIAALPVAEIADDPCLLVIWATWPQLPDALIVIKAWGFQYMTAIPWIKIEDVPQFSPVTGMWQMKPQYGIGFYGRGASEVALIAVRGNLDRTEARNQVLLLSENFQHSRKPDSLYDYCETYPGPYVELFARRHREGWISIGNEIDGQDIRDALPQLIMR